MGPRQLLYNPRIAMYQQKRTMKDKDMTSMVIWAIFGNLSICFIIKFQCEWYNTGNTSRKRTIRTETHYININVMSRWYKNDSFILPSQAKQIFYPPDTKSGEP